MTIKTQADYASRILGHYLKIALREAGFSGDSDTSAELNGGLESLELAFGEIAERLEALERAQAQPEPARRTAQALAAMGKSMPESADLNNDLEYLAGRLQAAEARIAALERVVDVGRQMRRAQRNYFAERSNANLGHAKRLEATFDKLAEARGEAPEPAQRPA